MRYLRISLRISRSAACLFRRDCTRQSSTSPSASTARHRYILLPPMETNISSRCQVADGLGRIALRRRAIIGPNTATGAVARLVGIEGGVVSGLFNPNESGVDALEWRPRHDEHYHEVPCRSAGSRDGSLSLRRLV